MFFYCDQLIYNTYENADYLGNDENPYVVLVKYKNTAALNCTIHEDTKVIYSSAFEGCKSLMQVTIGDKVTSIGESAFEGCISLAKVTASGSVTEIGNYAFYGCTALTEVMISDSVTSIGDGAFRDCSRLTSIIYGGTIEQWNAITKGSNWDNNKDSYTIHCTDGNIAKS